MSTVVEVKHTPGPWVVNVGRYAHITNGLYRGQIAWLESHQDPDDAKSPPLYVCEPNNRGVESIAESFANARLIAAAPELLGALKNLLAECEIAWCVECEIAWCVEEDEVGPNVEAARAAIAKAEGRES